MNDESESESDLEEPVPNVWPSIGGEAELLGQAAQVLDRLRRDVVEVHQVASRVQHREEQGGVRAELFEQTPVFKNCLRTSSGLEMTLTLWNCRWESRGMY